MSAPGRTFYRRPDHPESPSPFDGDDNQQRNASLTGSYEHRQNPSFAGGDRQQHGASFAEDDRPQRDDELPIRVTKYDEQVFGPEIFDKLQSIETPRCQAPRDFASKVRDIDDLFGEDERSADNYATTIADDDVITVEGVSGELITIDSWADAQLPEALMKNIARAKYIKPRQIQKTAIPLIMDRYDVIGQAETGSGKTAAYLIPIIAECMDAKQNGTFKSDTGYPYCVILAPTRELVRQCFDQARKFAHDTGITVANAYGEKPTRNNVQEINHGCDILVISPGRFKHLSDEGCIGFNKMRFLVFDEGDHLLTPVFLNDIRPILQLPSFPKGNVRQTLFFSATFDDEMINNAKEFMRDEGFRALVSNRKIAVNKKCAQVFCAPEHSTKFLILVDFMQKELEKANNDITKFPRTLVFVKSRDYCEKLAFALSHSGIASQPLSGRRAQDLREKAFDALRSNEISVLLVTDLCARGIDIKDLDLVINYDMPHDYDTYIHRAGRVGRIRNGECVSYVSPENDRPLLMKIKEGMEKAGQIVPHSLEEILRSSEESQLENQREEDVSIKDADKKVEESVTKEEKKRETLEIAAFEEIKPPASSKTASEVPSEKQSGEFDVPKSSLEIPGEIKPVDVKVGVGSRKAAAEEDYDEW